MSIPAIRFKAHCAQVHQAFEQALLRAVLQLWSPRQRSQRDAGEAIRRHVLWQRKLDLLLELVGRNKGADVAISLDGYLCVCVAHADSNPTATADLFQAKFTEMFAKVARSSKVAQ